MNGTIYKVCSQASDTEKGKIAIRPAIHFVPEYVIESERTEKNKDEFIAVVYRSSARDS